jgi:hypothetical protein
VVPSGIAGMAPPNGARSTKSRSIGSTETNIVLMTK